MGDGRGVGSIRATGVATNPKGQSKIPATAGKAYDSGESSTRRFVRVSIAATTAKWRGWRVTKGNTRKGFDGNTEEIVSIAASAGGGGGGDGGGGGGACDD